MSGMVTRSRFFSSTTLKVVNNVAKEQFTVSMKGADDAVLAYEISGKNITFHSTDVPEKFQGKGVGKLLAEAAFNHAQKNKLDVTCKCHFLAYYYEKNINKFKGMKVKFDLEDEN